MYSAISLLLFASCVKDDIYNTPHPDQGAIVLSIDWTAMEEGAEKPGSFTLHLRGTENVTAEINTAAPGTLPLLQPGAYSTLIYNIPEGFSITTDNAASAGASTTKATSGSVFGNHTATVRKAADGNTLLPTPGVLFTGGAGFTVLADDTIRSVIPIKQQTRRLLFRLTVTEGLPEHIISVSGTLSGVAEHIRLASGELGGSASVIPAFIRSGAEVTASLNLLGVTGTQKLTLLLTFADNRTQIIESDLTELLATFNDNRQTTLEVSGSLQTPVAIDPGTFTITDWQVQEKTDITVN